MRCKKCGYRLWNLLSRTCPECGTGFLPSEYEFNPNSVQFRCPHCNSVYYGTSDQGHLEPIEFECIGCRRRIHMDEMILLPTAGIEEQRTEVDRVPWLERRERGFVKAWFATIGMALIQPGRLMRALPDTGKPGAAWGFAILTNAPTLLVGIGLIFVIPAFFAIAGRSILVAALLPFAIMTALTVAFTVVTIFLWGLVTHGMLRATGATCSPISRTYEALCYSTGANVGTAIPCLGFYFGWIWWLISAVIMVKVAQKVRGWRAALAVLLFPGISMAVVAGLYAWLIYSTISGSGAWVMADARHRTGLVDEALIAYAQGHSGQGPTHAYELIMSGDLQAQDLVAMTFMPPFQPPVVKGPVPSPQDFAQMSPGKQKVATAAAIAALPSGTASYRLGEFVFVYPGIDFNTCDKRLWVVIWSPDSAGSAVKPSRDRVFVGHCDGTVESVKAADFGAALADQNKVRRASGLPPLTAPRSITQAANPAAP